MKPTLCLNMIVKDEARIIARCLAAVRPLISSWVIVDTGSTDGTQEIIRAQMANLPGELHERPWRNFGENRTEALTLCKGKADYTLIMDADDELVIPPGWQLPALDLDAYLLLLGAGGFSMYRSQILRSALPWRYEGVLHEYPTCDQKIRQGKLPGLSVRMHTDGARAADPEKYRKDARVLEEALAREPENTRYAFYLAQSYRDARLIDEAIAGYRRRAALGGAAEEVWYSLLEVAQLGDRRGSPENEVIAAYLAAFEQRPSRAESLCNLARYCRSKGRFASAYLFAAAAAEVPMPQDTLFVDGNVYQWRARDELAMAAQRTGRHEEAVRAATAILDGGKLPASERARVERVRAASAKALGGSGGGGGGGASSGA
jgi:glycosyltransferase involved in cell wall biosynthesis